MSPAPAGLNVWPDMISAVKFDRTGAALICGVANRTISYAELGRWVAHNRELIGRIERPALAFQFSPNSPAAAAAYLACLAERLPLGLAEPAAELRARVIAAYAPNALILPKSEAAPEGFARIGGLAGDGLVLWRRPGGYPVVAHPDLALLLATSGSTGDAKFVRLSHANLESNAGAIAGYLGLGPGEIAIQSLPLHYSYGLSVLNSHLVAGGAVAIPKYSFMHPEFWRMAGECRCTSFAGVPYMYETLHRMRVLPTDRPALRTMTQAGGHLRVELAKHFYEAAKRHEGRFFVMYGQTEATARMTYVPPERLAEKFGSIGVAIPGGKLWLEPVEGEATVRQLHYGGPNVMLGYAAGPADLARGNETRGVLATGDLAECDSEGFFRITGRLTRFAKLLGKRLNLASVEAEIERKFSAQAAVLEGAEGLKVFTVSGDPETIRGHLAGLLGVPPMAVAVVALDRLPLLASGKLDYRALS